MTSQSNDITRLVQERLFVVPASGVVQPLALDLLNDIDELARRGAPLRPGDTIEFRGWPFTLASGERQDEVLVGRPRASGNYLLGADRDLTPILFMIVQQSLILSELGLQGRQPPLTDKVVVERGCLDERRLHLEREAQVEPGDSGWYVGRVRGERPEVEYEGMWVYELIMRQPRVGKVLSLPAGYLVVLDGDDIEAILSPNDENVWTIRGES